MFQSKIRPIVIPQHEHLKIVGTLAYFWGNERFAKPPVEFSSFVKGLALHDMGYDAFDTAAPGAVDPEEKLRIWRRCTTQWLNDPAAEMIIQRHFLRLCAWRKTSMETQVFQELLQKDIDESVRQHALDPKVFDFIDAITNLCDTISFYFCMDEPKEGTVAVYTDHQMSKKEDVQFRIDPKQETITVTPWPFRKQEIEHFIIAYQKEGYPQTLHPVLLPYRVLPEAPLK